MKSIVVFNNKGGVGKTTLLCNLGACLSKTFGKKVVLVDTDPQSNATTYSLPEETVLEIYNKTHVNTTINEVFKELRRGAGYIQKEIPIIKSTRFEYDIIPGDPRLSTYEDFLSKDWFEVGNGEPRGIKTTLVFTDLNHQLEKKGYDFALYDVGPSLGAINRAVLLSADYFLLPMSSDIFSLKAVENIKIALDSWIKSLNSGLAKYEETEHSPYILNGRKISPSLRFLGYVTQQYITKTRDGKKSVVNAYEKIIKNIPHSIEENLVPMNDGLGNINYVLGDIPILFSLIPLSQAANAPIFDLKGSDGVVGAHFAKVKEYDETIQLIANNTLKNISKLS